MTRRSLFTWRGRSWSLAGTQLWEAAHSALKKIRATLSESAPGIPRPISVLFHTTAHGFGDYKAKAEIIDTLTVAFEDRRAVLLTYQSQHATEPATRDVYPYGLARHKGSLYLVALAVEHEAIRNFKVDRIDAAEITEFVFQRPKDFDMSVHLANAFGIYTGSGEVTVVVKFLPVAARFVQESKWHNSQVLTRERDGSLLASSRCRQPSRSKAGCSALAAAPSSSSRRNSAPRSPASWSN